MTPSEQSLAEACSRAAAAAGEAIAWFGDNKAKVHQEHPLLIREFRKFENAARKLGQAVSRPMCVGVFGPSQAGKSYLISALARRGEAPLIATFDGVPEGLDFVRQINPEGGAESTGLVTRFSIRSQPTHSGYPVAVRLLSQADVVKVIGNTFFSDCDLSEEPLPDEARLQALFDEARAAELDRPQPGLGADEIWDIQEYFERQFRGQPIVQELTARNYWSRLAELAPRVPVEVRAKLFGVVWGEIEAFSNLYANLTRALDALGHPDDACCEIEALVSRAEAGYVRRTDSVIDVTTLAGLGTPSDKMLSVRSSTGQVARLARPIIAALIAELHVTMRDRPWDFFEHTDLLDFPGARSRENLPDIRGLLKKPGTLEGNFLRGKVAYLFERYNAEQELTAMLLCIAPSNQEVRTLPAMVKDWVDLTHGATPDARLRSQTALFLVLTKFDAEFAEAAGQAEDSSERWSRRLRTALTDFFGKAHDWPHQWQPGRPFNQSFWLRNPNFVAKHILDYGANNVEVGIRAAEAPRIARAREEYLANGDVQRHFADAAQAWDAAFKLNDGGVTYLAESIAPVCNPDIKARQIAARLETQMRAMRDRLEHYHVSGDLGEQMRLRNQAAIEVIKQLVGCVRWQRFGGLLRAFQATDAELADVLFTHSRQAVSGNHVVGKTVSGSDLLQALGIEDDAQPDEGPAELFAGAAYEHWLQSIRAGTDNPLVAGHFQMSTTGLKTMIDEVIAGAHRLGLKRQLADVLKPWLQQTQGASSREGMSRPAVLAAETLNSFVMWLGYDRVEEAKRPRRRTDAPDRIFQPRAAADYPALEEERSSFDQSFALDWLSAYRTFVNENASSREGQTINHTQNDRLSTILARLVPPESSA